MGVAWQFATGLGPLQNNFLYGETRRKNALPFTVSMGMEIWFVASEPETVTQFVPSPSSIELVCICNHQPVWSAGQPKTIWPPLFPKVIWGEAVDTGRALTWAELVLSPNEFAAETTK